MAAARAYLEHRLRRLDVLLIQLIIQVPLAQHTRHQLHLCKKKTTTATATSLQAGYMVAFQHMCTATAIAIAHQHAHMAAHTQAWPSIYPHSRSD